MQDFINESDHVFTDISSEAYREYWFPIGMDFIRYKIVKPLQLAVSASGGHRIFDEEGLSHYVPAGWLHLVWRAKPGAPNFVK